MAQRRESPWYMSIVFAFILFWASFYTYDTLTDVENGHSHRINAIIAFVYETCGKIPAVGVCVLGGVFLLWCGITDFKKQNQAATPPVFPKEPPPLDTPPKE